MKSQHLKQNYPELVIFPTVDDNVDGAVKNLEEVGGAGQYLSPETGKLWLNT